MSTLTITRGLPASGKSGWAKAWVAADPEYRARVNRDDLRLMLYGASVLPWAQEEVVTKAQRAIVKDLLATGRDVVADDMNLRPRYVREWARFAEANGVDFDVFELPISVEESVERDAAREHPVGAEAIARMAQKYTRNGHLLPVPDDVFDTTAPGPYVTPVGAPTAVIVDLDGTLAIHNGRGPYEIERCGEDHLNQAVADAVYAAHAAGHVIIYCSGREDRVWKQTEAWLTAHKLPYGALLMRKDGDRRKDSIVKRELFDEHIRSRFDVRYVLDDRNQVVRMWRDLGLTVFQVAEGDF